MSKKVAFVFDENSKSDVSSDDIGELIELGDGRYILIPKLQGSIVGSPTQQPADKTETCDLYGCSKPAVVRLCESHYRPRRTCNICGQSGHVSSDCGLVLPNPPRR